MRFEFDIEIPPGSNFCVYHRLDDGWSISLIQQRYGKQTVLKKGVGLSFEAAMVELKQNIQKRDHV